MILSNLHILEALQKGRIKIHPLAGYDPSKSPFNTSAVDLRLGVNITVPKSLPAAHDFSKPHSAGYASANSEHLVITPNQPYCLKPHNFILAQTKESVAFPILADGPCYSARVEGKSSRARCGLIVHFTAPTIHSGFEGTIALEMINLGQNDVLLYPDVFICQLIIEEVSGTPALAPNQFSGQNTPEGLKSPSR